MLIMPSFKKSLIGRGATTAVGQLQWSQSLKKRCKETVKLHMTIKNNNEDGQTRHEKRYITDRWSVPGSCVLWVAVVGQSIQVVLLHDRFELTDLKVE